MSDGQPNPDFFTCESCERVGARGLAFHADGCDVAGGRYAPLVVGTLGGVACPNYPLGYPGCHPVDPTRCPDCMDGVAHVGFFGDRGRDPNRVLFVEVRALIPGACFLVHRGREVGPAETCRDDLRRIITAARGDGRRALFDSIQAARAGKSSRAGWWSRLRDQLGLR